MFLAERDTAPLLGVNPKSVSLNGVEVTIGLLTLQLTQTRSRILHLDSCLKIFFSVFLSQLF